MGDSISEGTVVAFSKDVGSWVETDEVILQIETDKVTVDVRAPEAGTITEILSKPGDTVPVGAAIVKISRGSKPAAAAPPKVEPAAAPVVAPRSEATPTPEISAAPTPTPTPETQPPSTLGSDPRERRVPMSRLRRRIAERLKDSQNTAAILTTFNEVDMSNLMKLRDQYKDDFLKKHNVKLGFMSAFVKASAIALEDFPNVNAVIDGNDIVYRDYVDVSVAVSTPSGLVVPVLRNCNALSFADIEKGIFDLGEKAKNNQLAIDDMAGGTFTISNGGVFGSLLSTPIINPPQSAILGMHAINKRPVVVDDAVVIRPMMYLALSYDHRLIDGREAVSFLRRIKDIIEDPRRLILSL